jgi:hypothetical protein
MSFFDDPIGTARRAIPGPGDIVGAVASAPDALVRLLSGANRIASDTTFGQSSYDFNYRTFPSDLANEYHGHYMVININVPTNLAGTARGAFTSAAFITSPGAQTEYSKVDVAKFGNYSIPGAPNALKRAEFTLPRFTKRIKESIALHMPSGLIFNTQNKYEDISMTALAGKVGQGAGALLAGGVSARFGKGSLDAAQQAASAVYGTAGAVGGALSRVSSIAGYPINPRVEVLYSHTDLRTFRFEVLMAPRNEEESIAIKAIIETLRFHAAPELDNKGFTFIPPAEFDITFYNKGEENLNIPRITTCILNVIETDYSPAGGVYSTFSNGHPVAVRLSLGFTEVEPLHKQRIKLGF